MGKRKYLILYPFSILFGLITDIRNILYDSRILHSKKFRIPVICIGNITVGGTGKTPHTEYIINLLRKEFRVAVLSRGYKRRSKGFRIVTSSSTVRETGDEPLQISVKFPDIIVAVDRKRRHGIETIIKEFPEINVVLLDDGFQHRSVIPGLSIILTDYNRLITRDYLMPYGRLRENGKNRRRADIIIISKTPEETTESVMAEIKDEIKTHSGQKLFFTQILYNNLLPLFENTASPKGLFPVSGNKDYGVVLITGIAVPEPLLLFIKKQFREVIHLDFPDHHYFSEIDFERIKSAWNTLKSQEKILITTEKDSVRLKEFANIEDPLKKAFYSIPMVVNFLQEGNHEFENLILDYVRKNN
jgi:tetraacyldisaccharide 4'-kinase